MIAKPDSIEQNDDSHQPMMPLNYAHNQPGSIPGTIAIADRAKPSEITLIDYNQHQHRYATNLTPEECVAYLTTESVSWVDVAGLGDRLTLKKLGQVFHLHPLLLENIVNVPQRPKLEDYQDQLVVIAQMVNFDPKSQGIWLEQVSFVLGKKLSIDGTGRTTTGGLLYPCTRSPLKKQRNYSSTEG